MAYFMPTGEIRQEVMIQQLCNVLSTLQRRPLTSPIIERIIMRTRPRHGELLGDHSWPLLPPIIRVLEDKFLELMDAGVCITARFEVNLSAWYHSRALNVKLRFEPKAPLDALYDLQAKTCLDTLRGLFPRLEARGALELYALPVDINDM